MGEVAGQASLQMREVVVWRISDDQQGVQPSDLH